MDYFESDEECGPGHAPRLDPFAQEEPPERFYSANDNNSAETGALQRALDDIGTKIDLFMSGTKETRETSQDVLESQVRQLEKSINACAERQIKHVDELIGRIGQERAKTCVPAKGEAEQVAAAKHEHAASIARRDYTQGVYDRARQVCSAHNRQVSRATEATEESADRTLRGLHDQREETRLKYNRLVAGHDKTIRAVAESIQQEVDLEWQEVRRKGWDPHRFMAEVRRAAGKMGDTGAFMGGSPPDGDLSLHRRGAAWEARAHGVVASGDTVGAAVIRAAASGHQTNLIRVKNADVRHLTDTDVRFLVDGPTHRVRLVAAGGAQTAQRRITHALPRRVQLPWRASTTTQ